MLKAWSERGTFGCRVFPVQVCLFLCVTAVSSAAVAELTYTRDTEFAIPSFSLSAGPVLLHAIHLKSNAEKQAAVRISLRNFDGATRRCTVTWDSQKWWSDSRDIYTMARKDFELGPQEEMQADVIVPYTNWNPYNWYPITCRVEVDGLQNADKMFEILGSRSRDVRLGEPRRSDQIQENKFGVNLNFGRPLNWTVLSASGLK